MNVFFPGFTRGQCEVFYKGGKLIFIVEGEVYTYYNVPENILVFLKNELNSDTIANKCLDELQLFDYSLRLEKFIICRYGGQDLTSDLVNGQLSADYFQCGKRGSCKHEFKLCLPILGPNNHKITKCEIEIIKLIAEDLTDKEIAAKLFIAETTARNHRANITEKLCVNSKNGIVRFAIEKNIQYETIL